MGAIDTPRLQGLLANERFVSRLLVLENCASTNDEVLGLSAQGAPVGTTVIADAQSAGRGRHGRCWHSPAGVGLYLSVLFRPVAPLEQWTRWTVAAALAVCEACRALSGLEVIIEWPNDLLLGGRKLAGILSEVATARGFGHALVVGVGINVNHSSTDFAPEIRERATSLRMARGGMLLDREALAARVLGELAAVSGALQSGEWNRVRERWMLCAPGARDRRVRVSPEGIGAGRPCFEGTTRGLDARGALLVQREGGDLVAVHAAGSVDPLEV